jgi:hypothetical protein
MQETHLSTEPAWPVQGLQLPDGRLLAVRRVRQDGFEVLPYQGTLRIGEIIQLDGWRGNESVKVSFRVGRGLKRGSFRLREVR